jgi:catechol 2,3-dioxygenase-like lactoylglutathione lyase family enzyme
MEIDHLTVPVRDYEASKAFYAAALKPLGFELLMDWIQRRRAYFGVAPAPSSLWLVESHSAGTLELAVTAPSVEAVDAFYFAAISARAKVVGEPSIVADRSGDYYAARVLDPDGNRLEVVHRIAAPAARTAA